MSYINSLQNHLDTLAEELKAAAVKFNDATGRSFDVDFSFADVYTASSVESTEILCGTTVSLRKPLTSTR